MFCTEVKVVGSDGVWLNRGFLSVMSKWAKTCTRCFCSLVLELDASSKEIIRENLPKVRNAEPEPSQSAY